MDLSNVTIREAKPEEYVLFEKVKPWDEIGPPDPMRTRALIAYENDTQTIIGFFFLCACVHLEPMWIREDYRRKPGLLRRMWRSMRELMLSTGNTLGFSVIMDHDIPRGNLSAVTGLGYKKVNGNLYVVNLLDPQSNKDSKPVEKAEELADAV